MTTTNGEPSGGHTAPPLLVARRLSKAHGRTPALRGASVTLRAGEILAVTGASGSGKSTLLHCLASRPDTGTVEYAGERLDTLPERRLSELRRTEFGVVFQFGQLIPELTVLDNVALPLLLAGTARAAAHERAGEWLERFGCSGSRRCGRAEPQRRPGAARLAGPRPGHRPEGGSSPTSRPARWTPWRASR